MDTGDITLGWTQETVPGWTQEIIPGWTQGPGTEPAPWTAWALLQDGPKDCQQGQGEGGEQFTPTSA